MGKLLSVVMPSYNSSAFIHKSIESLLIDDDRIELIIVNDGSTDNTLEIAQDYQMRYPDIIKVVDKANGGHGSAVVAGLNASTGEFFKVLDSDDWFGNQALHFILNKLEIHRSNVDMMISNYVYEKVGQKKKNTMNYRKNFDTDREYQASDLKLPLGKYVMMHSMIVKTCILKAIPLALPNHTFYVDNLYVAQVLLHIKNFIYYDVDLYHYYIGREDQSVNETVMVQRIDQQIKVNQMMLDLYVEEGKSSAVQPYFYRHLEIVTMISSVFLMIENTPNSLSKKDNLWSLINEKDPALYKSLRRGIMGSMVSKRGRMSRIVTLAFYRVLRRFIGFN